MSIKRIQATGAIRERELRCIRDSLQMALELGGPEQVLVWGRARLAMFLDLETRTYLEKILRNVQLDVDRPKRERAAQERRLMAAKRMELRKRLYVIDLLYNAEQKARRREGIEADRIISESLRSNSQQDRKREAERLERREQVLQQRLEQEKARRNGQSIPGRWLISR